ncbi:MAG: hypothetical protein M1833_000779 [Piccolia ochrophora]|nr:MAG: hypothetical protein M1833_000779 [Piccolia ochrophora]
MVEALIRHLFSFRSSTRLCSQCIRLQSPQLLPSVALFSTSPLRRADDAPPPLDPLSPAQTAARRNTSLSDFANQLSSSQMRTGKNERQPQSPKAARQGQFSAAASDMVDVLDYDLSSANPDRHLLAADRPPHHLHILATKHNTHLTLTRPNRDAIINISTGSLGFRKAGRRSYDASYQLASYFLKRVQEQGLLGEISRLEMIFRGFGPGREAVSKAMLGMEGRLLKGKVVRVTDATRLKFGGTRSSKPRRLG